MKVQSLLIIITIGFALLGVIGLILWSLENKPRISKIGKKIGRFSLYWIALMIVYVNINNLKRNYFLWSEQQFWEEYNLPQIDSTMILESSRKNEDRYVSWSKDSIRHSSKTVIYDVFDVYSVTDEFINYKERLELKVKFIKPNILRDSSRLYLIRKLDDSQHESVDTLTKLEYELYLKNWKLADKIKNRFEFRY